MAASVDGAEEVRKSDRACADLELKLRKGEVFRRGVRLATVYRPILSMAGQTYAGAQKCAQSIFQDMRNRRLSRGGIGRWVMDGFLDCLRGFARNLGELPH